MALDLTMHISVEHDPVPDRDPTGFCNSKLDPDRTGFRKKTLPVSGEISDFTLCGHAQSNRPILHIKYSEKTDEYVLGFIV